MMPKKWRFKTDRVILRKLFPPEIVGELKRVVKAINKPRKTKRNQ